ncbi:MAG TPA: toll/interleukin-1 receptor domain-containing protein [Thermoguttaceae bacterium]|nr:toll/interleukin-1 receptor domain-containing protein [Thermoguttaceae bacterium]
MNNSKSPSQPPPPSIPSDRLRVFLSYCSEEKQEFEEPVEAALGKLGLAPISDGMLLVGERAFSERLRSLIAHSHVFMPLMTKASEKRPWVNQEIGIAMGLTIPVVPLAIGTAPSGVIMDVAGIRVKSDLSDLEEKLKRANLEKRVRSLGGSTGRMVEVVSGMPSRATEVVDSAQEGLDYGYRGRVRIWDRLSAFAAPSDETDHRKWKGLYGLVGRGDAYLEQVRRERLVLERHAKESGCDLIVAPCLEVPWTNAKARKVKLTSLLQFLRSMPDDRVRVVCTKRARKRNKVLVGDWFVAESRFEKAGQGWRQTVFTRHAPTVWREVGDFDKEFQKLLAKSGQPPDQSRKAAMVMIEETIKAIR